MKILYLGIICGLIITTIFTIYTALAQTTDPNNQSMPAITTEGLATRLGGNTTGIYYPMYDLNELPQVLAAKKAFPIVPFNVNIN
ncbi:MAG: hypothetical protein ACREBI_11940, partial [Nitrosotalea sp.]